MPCRSYSESSFEGVRPTLPISPQGSRAPIRTIRVPFESAWRPAHDAASTSDTRAKPLKLWHVTYGSHENIPHVVRVKLLFYV